MPTWMIIAGTWLGFGALLHALIWPMVRPKYLANESIRRSLRNDDAA